MASMFIHLANTHMQIPNVENFPLGLSGECGKAKYSSLICRSMRSDRECVIIGVRGEEVWHGSAHVCQALKHTHTHSRPSHRYVPGPVGNLCLAKELSETLSSPISLTGVEKAWAAGEELGVAHRCTFRRMGFPLHSRLQAFFINQLRIFHCSGNNNFILMRENWCERASSVWV